MSCTVTHLHADTPHPTPELAMCSTGDANSCNVPAPKLHPENSSYMSLVHASVASLVPRTTPPPATSWRRSSTQRPLLHATGPSLHPNTKTGEQRSCEALSHSFVPKIFPINYFKNNHPNPLSAGHQQTTTSPAGNLSRTRGILTARTPQLGTHPPSFLSPTDARINAAYKSVRSPRHPRAERQIGERHAFR